MDKKYRIAIAGLGIGQFWAKGVFKRKDCESVGKYVKTEH